MESEHTNGILMRNLTYVVRFSRLTGFKGKFLANHLHSSDYFTNNENE